MSSVLDMDVSFRVWGEKQKVGVEKKVIGIVGKRVDECIAGQSRGLCLISARSGHYWVKMGRGL